MPLWAVDIAMFKASLRLSRHQAYARHWVEDWRPAWQRHARRRGMRSPNFDFPQILVALCRILLRLATLSKSVVLDPNVIVLFSLCWRKCCTLQLASRTQLSMRASMRSGTNPFMPVSLFLPHLSFVSNTTSTSLHT